MKKLLLFLIAFIAGNLAAQLSMEDNQILYLSFDDETELSYNDEGVEVLDENEADSEEGLFGNSIYFDGSGTYIVFDLIEDWNHGMDWTVSWWMKSDVTDEFWGIWSFGTYSGDPTTDYYDEDDRVGGVVFTNWEEDVEVQISWIGGLGFNKTEADHNWQDGEWHHFVLTYSTEMSLMSLYADNVIMADSEEDAFNLADDIATISEEEGLDASLEDDNLKLGFAGPGWLPEEDEEWPDLMWFNGYMDDFRLFNVAVGADEVDELYTYDPSGASGIQAQSTRLFEIYPNPASEFIQIRTESTDVAVNIFNISGQNVLSSFNETKINISSLAKGVYFLEATIKGDKEVQKLIVK